MSTTMYCTRFLDCDGLATSSIAIDFDRIKKLEPDHIGPDPRSEKPCFRLEYYDTKDRYDKVIYIRTHFKVS